MDTRTPAVQLRCTISRREQFFCNLLEVAPHQQLLRERQSRLQLQLSLRKSANPLEGNQEQKRGRKPKVDPATQVASPAENDESKSEEKKPEEKPEAVEEEEETAVEQLEWGLYYWQDPIQDLFFYVCLFILYGVSVDGRLVDYTFLICTSNWGYIARDGLKMASNVE